MTTVTTNHAFNAFSLQVERTRDWLRARCFDALGFSRDVLLDRLAQAVVDQGLAPFARTVRTRRAAGDAPMPPEGTVLPCGPAQMTIGSGRLSVSTGAAARLSVEFFTHWAYALVAAVAGAFRGRQLLPAVLVDDLNESDIRSAGGDAPFIAFCRQGPITPLRTGRRFYVAAANTSASSDAAFTYCRYPLVSLLRDTKLGLTGRARLVWRHLMVFVAYPFAVWRLPALAMFGRELAYAGVARELDRQGAIEAVVHTCSSYRLQPIWARGLLHARTHMLWYAQNWRPLRRSHGDTDSQYPSLRWIRADEHWVWTQTFADYLGAVLPGQRHVVGPILFRLPARRPMTPAPLVVLVFDLPAVSDEIMIDPNGEIDNYFHPDYLCAFIREITALKPALEQRLGRAVSLRLKMKRGYQPDYARAYYEFVDDATSSGAVELAEPRDNLFEMVSEAAATISYPYTSAAYVAEFLGVPSVFYDPTRALVSQDFSTTGRLPMAGNPDALLDWLAESLARSATAEGCVPC